MLVKSGLAGALCIDLRINSIKFLKDRAIGQRVINIGSGELGKVLGAVLNYGTGSGRCKPLAAVQPIKFVIILVRKLLFPFAPFFLNVLLNEDS
jgi:hypothetical protein